MKKDNSGVTLLELLVIISIIMIMAIGTSQLSFSRLSDIQKLDIFMNDMINTYETTRNYALIGKGVGTDLQYPEEWSVSFSASQSGGVKTYYNTGNSIFHEDSNNKALIKFPMVFEDIECLDRDGTVNDTITGSTDTNVIIRGRELSLSGGCVDPDTRKIRMNLLYRGYRRDFSVNIINGLVEK